MKVLQINTIYKFRSTGRTCWEVEKALEANGDSCLTVHQVGELCDKKHSLVVNTKLGYYFHKLMSRLLGLDGYFSYFATKKAIRKIQKYDPDIIHLRNLHGGYLNLPLLFRYLRDCGKPVIYNLHDTWAYTGKCPEYSNVHCEKWKTQCFCCPQWKRYPKSWFFDFSRKMYNDKRQWYAALPNLTVVGVSDWISGEAGKSILGTHDIRRVYNWVDRKVFLPSSENILPKYGCEKTFTVLGVSSGWVKNTEFEEFCTLAGMLQGIAQVVLVGGESLSLPYENMKHIPFTKSTEELAALYSSADVFVLLSTAESFGKVAAEALSCGTPVIVYDVTGCAELAGEGCGYRVPVHDLKAVENAILQVKKAGKQSYVNNCLGFSARNFNYETNVSQLISIYREKAFGGKESL